MEANRILVISAESGVGSEFAHALMEQGFVVETAHGMAEAQQLVAKRAVEVVLAEMQAPFEDNLWYVGQLKEAWPQAEILVFMGHGVPGSAEQIALLDVRGLLPRPLTPASVTDLLGLEAPAAAEQTSRSSGTSRVSRMARNVGLFLAAPFTATFYTLALPFVAAYVFGRSAWETVKKKRASG